MRLPLDELIELKVDDQLIGEIVSYLLQIQEPLLGVCQRNADLGLNDYGDSALISLQPSNLAFCEANSSSVRMP